MSASVSNAMKLVIGSDGMGRYGMFTVTNILKIAYPGVEIVWDNHQTPDLVIRSHFPQVESHQPYECPYITWSGEARRVNYNGDRPPICEINTIILPQSESSIRSFHVPYAHNYMTERNMFLESSSATEMNRPWSEFDFLPSPRFFGKSKQLRPYFCVYIASNPVWEREQMFQFLRNKTGDLTCHALGPCSNNLSQLKADETVYNHVIQYAHEKEYRKNLAIQKNYRFALVMENTNLPGYVTEKLVNAFRAGAIPIYWGGGGFVNQIFNPKSYINVSDFPSFDTCADYVIALDQDQSRYSEMRAQPVFIDNQVPDLFNGLQSQYLTEIAEYIKLHLFQYNRKSTIEMTTHTKVSHIPKVIEPLTEVVTPKPVIESVQSVIPKVTQTPKVSETPIRYCKADLIDGIDSIFWINLDRCPDRKAKMELLLRSFKVPNHRISATDGCIENASAIFRQLKLPSNPALRLTQYGCLLSHLEAIRHFIEKTSHETILVLEDDISFDFMSTWNQSTQQIMDQAPADWELIMLSYISLRELVALYTPWHPDPFGRWQFNLNGTMAYLINRKGGQKLMDLFWKGDHWMLDNQCQHVADEVLYHPTRTYVYKYPYFVWSDENDTLVGNHNDYLSFHRLVKAHLTHFLQRQVSITS